MSNVTAIRPDAARYACLNTVGADAFEFATAWLKLVLAERGPDAFQHEIAGLVCKLAGIAQRELGNDAAEEMLAIASEVLEEIREDA